MKIPVFVSCPTSLSTQQNAARQIILRELERLELEPRALGRSDYPTDLPLREVAVIAKHCSGGVILGFEQFHTDRGTWKRGAKDSKPQKGDLVFPTAWNHLEAGILYGLRLPLLVFREDGIRGGVFDDGVTDAFVHVMPKPNMSAAKRQGLSAVFLKWQGRVRDHYYRDT
jgi:hypothetical protein